MKREIKKMKKAGYRIVYIDETMFTRRTTTDTEWCLPKSNVKIETSKLNEPPLALLSGVSKEKGQEHYKIFPDSVNIIKFKEYLDELR